ncbi:MAG TPA: cysteine--tRNA ligase [Vicinamibacteria bacterium]|nr:cysteine--tRNA ligase [Vicinamibacteria bacterium]
MTQELRLFNTMSGRVETLVPQAPPEVSFYACGPTVYNRAHVGNFRSFVATDVLRRTLRHFGYRVREVMNVTDVDDRIIQKAQEAGTDLGAFTAEYVKAFEEDMATLRLERPEHMPRATAHIPEMLDLIARLQQRGHTYTADGSVYFRIASFPEYGRLARLDVAGIQAGARVDTDKYDKENARDFVLWKFKSDEPEWAQWEAPFGKGRPGWHIECSAMSMKYLGETFDLHAGGEDLIFPHHENEIAQSTCGTGKLFARHWMHVKHLLIDNETMSKSKGNFLTIPDLVEKGHSPQAIRYLLAGSHYRKPLNFGFEGLSGARAALERLHGLAVRLDEVSGEGPEGPEGPAAEACVEARQTFDASLADDLNTPEALAAVHGLVGRANALLAEGALTRAGAARVRAELAAMDVVFGVLLPGGEEDRLSAEEQGLFDERQDARRRREFARADAARGRLEALGVVLEDTPKGTRWRRKG